MNRLLNVESAFTPAMLSVNVTGPTRKGLCGPLSLIEPAALAYAPLPVPPMMVWSGPAVAAIVIPPPQITQTTYSPEAIPAPQPVGLTAPASVPTLLAMLVDWAEELARPVKAPPPETLK